MIDSLLLQRTGDKIPLVGLGTYQITNDQGEEAIYNAIKVGYRHIDTASVYANEQGVGRGIKKAIDEGIVTRKDLFVVTKLWNAFHRKEHVRPAFDRQLKDLGLDYIDLYYMHWPLAQKYVDPTVQYPTAWDHPETKKFEWEHVPVQETWHEMEKLADQGLVRNLGIANFNVQLTLDLLTYCNIKPDVIQVEIHPYLQRNKFVDWMKRQGIQVTAYSSFGSAAFNTFTQENKNLSPLLQHETIKRIADKHGKTTSQVLLRWAVERKVTVIPKSGNVDRMKTNLDLFSFSLDDHDHNTIAAMNANIRFNDLEIYGIDIPLYE
ncbi:xylose reductase [Lichtheimia hyalospora FSU 10163]|nr:xylose reductase [Lichtheimia hyalospora FSU 10163]